MLFLEITIMHYEEFERRVRSEGLEPRMCSADHWQIRGGVNNPLVNFWPHTKKGPKVYVPGAKKAVVRNLQYAIDQAGPRDDDKSDPPWEPPREERPVQVGFLRRLWRLVW